MPLEKRCEISFKTASPSTNGEELALKTHAKIVNFPSSPSTNPNFGASQAARGTVRGCYIVLQSSFDIVAFSWSKNNANFVQKTLPGLLYQWRANRIQNDAKIDDFSIFSLRPIRSPHASRSTNPDFPSIPPSIPFHVFAASVSLAARVPVYCNINPRTEDQGPLQGRSLPVYQSGFTRFGGRAGRHPRVLHVLHGSSRVSVFARPKTVRKERRKNARRYINGPQNWPNCAPKPTIATAFPSQPGHCASLPCSNAASNADQSATPRVLSCSVRAIALP